MMGPVRVLILSGVMLIAHPSVEAQQAPAGQAADSLEPAGGAVEVVDVDVGTTAVTQPLPRRAPQPRTLHDFWPAFAVLAALWVAMLGYVLPMRGSLRRIADRMLAEENRTAGQ